MGFPDVVAWIGNAQLLLVPVPLIIFVLLAVCLHVILTKTSFGLKATMYGANPLAALFFAAIDINKLLIRIYVISGVLSSVAGMVVMSRANSAKADYGSSYLLLAVLIAVLGGVNPMVVMGVYGCCAGGSVDAVPVKRIEHAAGVKFARELIWGALLIFVMVVNTTDWNRFRTSNPVNKAVSKGGGDMKKILNSPANYVDEMLAGLVAAHPEYYRLHGDSGKVVARAKAGTNGKVGIVTGGGSGHLPVFTGYVGEGLLDACAIGDVFASPSAEQMADAIRSADQGAGVLRLYGNYGGDILNLTWLEIWRWLDICRCLPAMWVKDCIIGRRVCPPSAEQGWLMRSGLRITDILNDMAGDLVEFDAPHGRAPEEHEKRRGVAGMVYAFATAGAAAEEGRDLDAVTAVAQKTADSVGRSALR